MKRVYRLSTNFIYIPTSAEGAVLVNSQTSEVYEVSGFFSDLLWRMDKWRSEDEMARALAEDYGGSAPKVKEAVSKFVSRLSDMEALETKRTVRRPLGRLSSTSTKKKLTGKLQPKGVQLSQDQLLVAGQGYCISDADCPPGNSCAVMADICLQYCYYSGT